MLPQRANITIKQMETKQGIKSPELLPADWVSSLRRLTELEMH